MGFRQSGRGILLHNRMKLLEENDLVGNKIGWHHALGYNHLTSMLSNFYSKIQNIVCVCVWEFARAVMVHDHTRLREIFGTPPEKNMEVLSQLLERALCFRNK